MEILLSPTAKADVLKIYFVLYTPQNLVCDINLIAVDLINGPISNRSTFVTLVQCKNQTRLIYIMVECVLFVFEATVAFGLKDMVFV